MRSQWECLLENLGCWQGSFTRLSPKGEILEDIPSETSLELKEDQKTMRQVVRRFYDGQPQDLVLEYRSLNKSIILFENGAFSQGAIQFAPFTEFGAEFGLIFGDRRLRLIPVYNKSSQLERITLIREHLPQSTTPERPPLTLDQLLGRWEGESITIFPNWLTPEVKPTVTEWQREGDRAILFLPDGASLTCPQTINPRQPFRLSISWLLEPNLHQRMIRTYDQHGEWTNLTLVTERKVG
jgi:hypothetical protein